MTPSGVALFAAGWSCGWLLLWRRSTLPPRSAPPRTTAVAVVVPARDEAANLPGLLASIVPQLREGDELVVVDDASVDGTAGVAASAGARVVAAPALAEGWSGKASACAAGASATHAPVLVFVDADVTLEPGALDRLASALEHRPGVLVSVQPWHRMPRAVEQLSVPCSLVAVAGTGAWTPWGRRVPTRLAYGPVLATGRADYERVGGHAHPDVRASVVDDIALAHRYDGAVVIAADRTVASFRMYPGGFAPLAEGWTKNLAAGAAGAPWWAVLLTAGWLWSMIGGPGAGWPCWLASAAQVWLLGRRVGEVRWWSALLAPLGASWFLVLLTRSTVRRLRRRPVRWRGRELPAR